MNNEYSVIQCPYDPNHKISASRIQIHLVKCEKNFPEKFREICPFNATHRFAKEEMAEHVEKCPMRRHLQPELYQKFSNCGSIKLCPTSDIDTDVDLNETWEDDCDSVFSGSRSIDSSLHFNKHERFVKHIRPPRGFSAAIMIEPSESGSVIDDSASVVSAMGMGRGTTKAFRSRPGRIATPSESGSLIDDSVSVINSGSRSPKGFQARSARMAEPSESGSIIDDSVSVVSAMGVGRGTTKFFHRR